MGKNITLTDEEIQALGEFFEDNLEVLESTAEELSESNDEDDRIAGADLAKQAAVLRKFWKKI